MKPLRFLRHGQQIWDTKTKLFIGEKCDEHLTILNAHEDLVEALKLLTEVAEESCLTVFNREFEAVQAARLALAKAGEAGKGNSAGTPDLA